MHAALRLPTRQRTEDLPSAEPAVSDESASGPDVAALISQAQHGDIVAFERLMAMYQTKIHSFARAFVSDPELASDVTQDAMLRIYRSLGGFRFQSSLQTWMFRIVRNIVLDYAKSRRNKERKREQPLEATSEREIGEATTHNPEAALLAHERKSQIWSALAEIPEAYRSVLVLADIQGMSYEEVAAIVETPVGTVKSRLNRGREALREVLLSKGCLGEGKRS